MTRADTMMSQANTFALSPDGTQIAFAADGVVATAFEVYVMPATGATAPTRLTSGTIAAGRGLDAFRTPRWNPAGTAIAFGADYGATDDKFQPYVLPLAGGAAPARDHRHRHRRRPRRAEPGLDPRRRLRLRDRRRRRDRQRLRGLRPRRVDDRSDPGAARRSAGLAATPSTSSRASSP
jgi:hypothetical protein